MRARVSLVLATIALACGPQAESDDGVVTGTDETTAGTTMTAMTTVAATTGGPIDGTSSGTADPDSSTGPGTSTGDPPGTSTGDPPGTTGTGETTSDSTGEMGNGECTEHGDCASGYCREFSDAPPDPESLCQDPPAGGNTRFTGTVRDVVTLEPVDGADVAVVGALQALTDPTGAMALASATTDGEGQFDGTSAAPVMAALGAIAITTAADYFLTETGVAAPEVDGSYPPGNTIHDLWAVRNDDLDDWSAMLQADGANPSALPLGEAGGFIVIVRDSTTGDPLADGTLTSTDGGSTAEVYYLSSDGMGLVSQTSDLGIAIVLDPALAEVFTVQVGGADVGQITSGSVDGAIFAAGMLVD